MKKTVCIIGKPNVGKSTIFNRLVKDKKAIIMDTPGVTRDRLYDTVTYNNKSFFLIDTGGIEIGHDDFNEDIKVQAELAIDESDLILFVVDGKNELDPNDYLIRDMLIKSHKDVVVVVNKLDNKWTIHINKKGDIKVYNSCLLKNGGRFERYILL